MAGRDARDAPARAVAAFSRQFHGSPQALWTAPGRVNLIGDHTDYDERLVLPFALPQVTAVAVRPVPGRRWLVHSEQAAQRVQISEPCLSPAPQATRGRAATLVA